MKLPKIIILFFILISYSLSAQTGTLRGLIYDKETNEPVSFCNALIEGTKIGAVADINGIFTIGKLQPGEYTLIISFVNYNTQKLNFKISAGEVTTKKIFLEPSSKQLDAVEISAEKQEAQNTVKMSVIKATRKEISAVPAVGGESDIATYFQTVPGVVTTGDQGGQLYVRGGAPIQNKVLLDGMIIYNPFHSIGFYSVFDTDIIQTADIYTGGFNAEHGGRISSIMDIKTRSGNKSDFGGKISVNPFGAKALLEGPLKKPKKENEISGITYILSAKTSYMAQSSKLFYKYVDSLGLPFTFNDIYGKISFNGNNGSKFNVFGFYFDDSVRFQQVSDLRWRAFGAGTNFVLVPTGNPVIIEGNFSFSDYNSTLNDYIAPERNSGITSFNAGFDFKYFLKRDEIKYGVAFSGFATRYKTFNAVNRTIQQDVNNTEGSAYIQYKLNRGSLLVEPGFRLQFYPSVSNISPEPRLGVKYNANENLRFKLATGIYSQNLIASNSDRDVVNLFYGYLSGTNNIPETYVNEDGETVTRKHVLQKANHFIVGTEYDLSKNLSLNIEAYYKDFTQLTNINRNKLYDDDGNNSIPDILKKDFIIETGNAYGLDFVLKYSTKKTYIWFVYSLAKVNRWDGLVSYNPVFDRRHNINLVATQTFGNDGLWEINARWNYGSGLPFTPTGGYYQNIPFNNLNTNYTQTNTNQLGILYGDLNSARLSDYHRLDISVKRRVEFKKIIEAKEEGKPAKEKITSEIEIIASATNIYNRRNIFYVDRVSNTRVYQLPIIPALGVSWKF